MAGHSLGNLVLAGLAASEGGLEGALATLGRLLGARGRVVPAAPVPLTLQAVIDGAEVRGQVAIALGRGRIESLEVRACRRRRPRPRPWRPWPRPTRW